ncbi:hypothetical protein RH858_13850 [Halalkaliarchaeum sp. AArc-GB]|uniref:phenylacetate--CoA ligase family protein n=1 Tax=Halalkaliarchaeum sp. AArc-GB TaxID=3074078 RepID=UPI0028593D5D|nr:hypothetical protein [Halalkaliarchaeum sp. AArc-GB]MDR5674214.1 hypothetical protein [Halalkaliarchaeum sp. AArc-GB]
MTELEVLRSLSTNEIKKVRKYQTKKLLELLNYANNNSPYYSKKIPDSVLTNDVQKFKVEHMEKIPVLQKQTLKNENGNISVENLENRDFFRNRSGGSTGEPVEFVQDQQYLDSARAVTILFDEWSGYYIGERRVRLWGSERDLFQGQEKIMTRIKRYLKNEIWLNSFRMTEEDMKEYVEKINSFQPVQLLGYADSTYELAKFAEAKGLEVHSPTAVMTSAGKLYPHMREQIEQTFDAPVYDRYGSREVGDIACECSNHEGLHISSPTHFVEVVDDDGNHVDKGEQGHVLVTSLTNYSMPFIRYRIGDMAVWGGYDCSCDLPFPVLKEISGRETSMFYTKDGDVVSPEYFIHLLGVVLDPEWLEKFQVVQQKHDHVVVKCVPSIPQTRVEEDYSNSLQEITEKIQLVLGDDCTVDYNFVSEIPPSDSGKYLYAVSEVN